jgi:AraC-like DNA-binding protein
MQVAQYLVKHEFTETERSHREAVERVILEMRKRLHEPLTLQEMADIAYLSPYHFCRIFSRLIGVPPYEFLSALRLDEAKKLLLTTSLSVTDVCFEVGYSSLGSFTTRFTQLVGQPPRQLRQMAESLVFPSREIPDVTSPFYEASLTGCLIGTVYGPETFRGNIHVGLFTRPIPQGRPVRCTRLTKPGPYLITGIPDGMYYVLCAAFSTYSDPFNYLVPGDGVLVGMSQGPVQICDGQMNGESDITLHPPLLTDPPLVVALPFI